MKINSLFNPSRINKALFISFVVAVYFANFFGYLEPIVSFLERFTFSVGSIQDLTLYSIIKRSAALLLLAWLTIYIMNKGIYAIDMLSSINPSNRSILGKIFQSLCYFLAFLFGLNILNIDITHFAVFSGAIGIGIGLGLQKVTSNFVSGLLLSFEKSIEPGHLIEIDNDVYGIVQSINARYTLIKCYDGRSVILPNEYFVSHKVINWSYKGPQARISFSVGIAYDSDINLARDIIKSILKSHPSCSDEKEPLCLIKELDDSSINLFCAIWVTDITKGRLGIKSELLDKILVEFANNNIEIPFPRRVIYTHDMQNTNKKIS